MGWEKIGLSRRGEPNSTKSYKLERVIFKTQEYFPSALYLIRA